MPRSLHGIGASTTTRPASARRAIIVAVTSLLTLATTIGESEVAGSPPMVVPDARWSASRPSRTTVIVTAGLARASASNAAFELGSHRPGGGSTVVAVVVVVVVVVLVVDDEVLVEVVLDDVVEVVVAGEVLVVVDVMTDVDVADAAALARVDVVELHPAAPSAARVTRAVSRRYTPDTIGSSRLRSRAVASGVDELGTE